MKGTLILAAAPIGQASDASPRLCQALATAPVIAAEDTRRLRRLAADLGVSLSGRIVSYYDQNERSRAVELLSDLLEGRDVLVVTDAGMPGVSDPGYRLVVEAVAADVPMTVLPGPSAVTTALVLSGLPTDRFCFEGFLPRKPGERATRLSELASEPRTMVFFEAPHRLSASLEALAEAFGGERAAAVCRELTKTYEEIKRGPLADLVKWAADGVKGEITLVVAGAPPRQTLSDPAELAAAVFEREAAGISRKDAIAEIAKENDTPKKIVYNAVLAAKSS